MTKLVFLETALNDTSAEQITESNEAIIDYAVAKTDSLVEAETKFNQENFGRCMSDDLSDTYENLQDPIADVVIESAAMFGEIIADTNLTDAEKMAKIDEAADVISEDGDLESLFPDDDDAGE